MCLAVAVVGLFAMSAPAQWVDFDDETSFRLSASAGLGSADPQEKDYAWGDVDQDGDIDLVCVRKQPWTTTGRFPNVLFMNEGGILVDRTTQFASDSAVANSQGFLDATNDRDVKLADLNGDGWLDMVTAVTLSGTEPKYISHPRVYINRQNDGSGMWLGFTFDDENRMPTMPAEPRFCSVSVGDVDGDGDLDVYMGDYQQGPGTRVVDLNDRLFINDGTGYFADESATRMSVTMLESSFGMATAMADFNNDGKIDIMKDDALNAPQGVSISYNDTATEGFFGTYNVPYSFSPYHINVGDLNNDGLTDFLVSDDGQDRYAINNGGNGSFTILPFTYDGGGSDDGFGGNNIIADLNNDGLADCIVTDVDVDISGCSRRAHIFRNLGNLPNPTIQEQQLSGEVAGIPTGMLVGSHDVAVFDINGDGWNDLVLGRCTGTQVWINQPPIGIVHSYPQGLPAFVPPGQPFDFQIRAEGIGGSTPQGGSLQLFVSVAGAPFSAATTNHLGNNVYQGTLPAANCIEEIRFYVTSSTTTTAMFSDPAGAPAVWNTAIAAAGTTTVYETGFENGSAGWTVQNTNLTSGAWQVADPNGTISGGAMAAPEDDAEAITTATMAFVTQNGTPGGAAGAADVDGGPTTLPSPGFDLAGTDGFVSMSRWFYTSGADAMTIQVSGNGAQWTTVETISGSGNNQWIVSSFRVGDFIVPTSTTQVRISIADQPNDSITEGGIDAFRISTFTCETCQANIGLNGNGNATLELCGGDLSSGTTADLRYAGGPPNSVAIFGYAASLNPVPAAGGMLFNPNPGIIIVPTDGNGEFVLPGVPGGGGPFSLWAQVAAVDPTVPGGISLSNAIRADFLP
ncbi:MAG: hypothetical protein CMJ83_20615 [Planctomycetes bacterium]|nr:hypothetical protein [Planctomycetota bacterium]